MYDIRQFRPSLYVLLVLGFSGFALAAQAPGLWVLSIAGVGINAWLIRRGYFSPLPRILANLITLLALVYIVLEVRLSGMAPILVIGQFLVLLQLVKLYEQRANRDYAQLIVLSLLLMVAAAINTASLAFGLMFIAYLFLSLYCCLLFHLKVETDHAKVAMALADLPLDPSALRHDQQFLTRSMRRLTLLISGTAIAMSVLVFLFFPRETGANLLAPLQTKNTETLSGFSDSVSFQNIARIAQNNEVVAHVRVWHNGKPVSGTHTLWLRGTTLNVYHGGTGNGNDHDAGSWTWERNVSSAGMDVGGELFDWIGTENSDVDQWRQEISLQPTGTNVLFAMPGPLAIKTDPDLPHVHYFSADETLQTADPLTQPTHYEVISRDDLDFKDAPRLSQDNNSRQTPGSAATDVRPGSTNPEVKKPFLDFARRPEVSGSDAQGPLAARRDPNQLTTPLDGPIAQHICDYLRENYRYTLDLTDARNLNNGKDPLLAFLTDFKKGHCEFFAGAMTILCQSLGMDARMVVGFKCDEFNDTPGAYYYIVRQSHAHAWVEVRTPAGWETFDPTSSRQADTVVAESWWGDMKHVLDYLEYTWANNVVAYDRDDQGNLIKNAEAKLTNVAIRGTNSADNVHDWMKNLLRSWFTESNFFIVSSKIIAWAIYLLIFALVGAVAGFFWGKWKLRQRARRIGLDNLPASDQMRLARQLGFYDDLIQLLERHNITRPRHLTPMEFSNQITFLPAETFDAIHRLTSIFYRIRYGRHEISYEQRQRLNRVIARIGESLSARSS